MPTTTRPELLTELRRRHVGLIRSLALGLTGILCIVLFIILKTLVLNELRKIQSTLEALEQISPEEEGRRLRLKQFLDSIQGYFVVVETSQELLTTPDFPFGPFVKRLLDAYPRGHRRSHLRGAWVGSHLKLVLVCQSNDSVYLIVRADNPFWYYMALLTVIALLGVLLFLNWRKGEGYLLKPVEQEMTWARELDGAKERFFATIFHEVGTPLTSLMARLETLIHQTACPKTRHGLECAYLDAQRISMITGDQLQRSRFEIGTFTLNQERIHADEFAEILGIRLELLLRHHGMILREEIPERFVFWGDRLKLEQAVTNFVTNAIKYASSSREIRLGIACHDGQVRISVTDQGPGIEPGLEEVLLQPFQKRRKRDLGGLESTGLGLFLADNVARAHGGRLQFQRHERGFTVSLEIPLLNPTA